MGIGKGVWVGWTWMVDGCWRHVSRIFLFPFFFRNLFVFLFYTRGVVCAPNCAPSIISF